MRNTLRLALLLITASLLILLAATPASAQGTSSHEVEGGLWSHIAQFATWFPWVVGSDSPSPLFDFWGSDIDPYGGDEEEEPEDPVTLLVGEPIPVPEY